MNNPTLIHIATITGAHGIRGEVKIRSAADLFSYKTITDESGKRAFTLTKRGTTKEGFIASLAGVENRNEAELLKGAKLYAPASSMPKKKDTEWYYGELKGLEAWLENGEYYGRVIGVYNFGAGDIIEIEREDQKTEMLPLIEPFVGDIHEKQGYLIVTPPDYVEANDV